MATIDVLLPVRNGIAFLGEALDSICNQTFRDWRLVVLDHGSTDGSRELAETYRERDSRVEVVTHSQAKGLADLLNFGISLADCRYLMRHDADDVCYPDRMEVTLAAFEAMPSSVAISGQIDGIGARGEPWGEMTLPVGKERVTVASFFRNPVSHPAAMFDFTAMRALGVRYGTDFLGLLPEDQRIEIGSLAEDYFLFGQLALLGRCVNLPNKLIKYRWHGSNVSMLKYRDQLLVALDVARYLVRNFCVKHGLESFDPAPFCSVGDQLFEFDGNVDFGDQFDRMASILRRGLGASDEVERELAFRKVVATRRDVEMARRFAIFCLKHRVESGERHAVKKWLLRRLPRRQMVNVPLLAT